MIDNDVEIFLTVTANAFLRAVQSGDPHQMHTVIQNAHQVIDNYEGKAFTASIKTLNGE